MKDVMKRKKTLLAGIEDNYRNVIANVQNMKNAKVALEYLKELGFDTSSLIEADNSPVTTALSVAVDTRFLFIGGKNNAVE
jgi:3-dehydroquinate synthase class II